jgi:hypothetical protein
MGLLILTAGDLMRLLVVLALFCTPLLCAAAEPFSGAWIAWLCPAGTAYDPGRCSNLVIELYQKQDRVCGAHVFATAGAGQLDEGSAPSVSGSISNGIALVSVESGRVPGLKVSVEIRPARNGMQWRRLDSPEGNHLLPPTAHLSKSRHGSLFNPVFAQKLEASCSQMLNVPAAPASTDRSAAQQGS